MTIKQELYSGVPVTNISPEEHEPMHKACSRLDRCFLAGHGKELQQLRAHLRVIAGCRLRRDDLRVLTKQQLETCVNACPEAARYACFCLFVALARLVCCSAFVREVAEARNITGALVMVELFCFDWCARQSRAQLQRPRAPRHRRVRNQHVRKNQSDVQR